MLFMIVRIVVAREDATSFERAFSEFAQTVRAVEPGTLVYELARDRQRSGHYTIIEGYRDEASQQAHSATPHMEAFLPIFSQALEGAPDVQIVEAIDSALERQFLAE